MITPNQQRDAENSLIKLLLDPDIPARVKQKIQAVFQPPEERAIDNKVVASRRTALDGRVAEPDRFAAVDYLLSIQRGVDPDATRSP